MAGWVGRNAELAKACLFVVQHATRNTQHMTREIKINNICKEKEIEPG